MINFAMYIGVVRIILLFRNSSHMEAAYGLAITSTMLMTTLLLGFYQMCIRDRYNTEKL